MYSVQDDIKVVVDSLSNEEIGFKDQTILVTGGA